MKLLFLFFVLSFQSTVFALTCNSLENPAKVLNLKELHPSSLVQGETIIRIHEAVFAGSFETMAQQKIYTLFNQNGEKFKFILNLKKLPTVGHCRTRICDDYFIPDFNIMNGKLMAANSELEDEYFSCF